MKFDPLHNPDHLLAMKALHEAQDALMDLIIPQPPTPSPLSAEMVDLLNLADLAQDAAEAAKISTGLDTDIVIHVHSTSQDTQDLMEAAALLGWEADQFDTTVWVRSGRTGTPQAVVYWTAKSELAAAAYWAHLMGLRQSSRGREVQAYIANKSPMEALAQHEADEPPAREHRDRDDDGDDPMDY